MNSRFATVPDRPDFPGEEQKVLQFWTDIDAFHKQLEHSKGKKAFTFYDGPPFATGLPHYGHIAAGTIKDVVTRYATMTGHHVERKFGWDCHGLPIEFEIEKMHKIKDSQEREAIGITKYNSWCREIVMRYSKEWETIIGRFGRWIDFKNDYKTMDCNYMESVWWTFAQIHKKGLVYRGSKIMPFSTACNTVLSNFEAGSNYKDVSDPAVIITLPLLDDPNVSLIAWTTTPWTLPSNLALCVHPTLDYVKFLDEATEKIYICMEKRLDYVVKQCKIKKHKVLEKMKGAQLKGLKYEPLFPYFHKRKEDGCFQVLNDTYVTTDAGTGVVHQAPGFGEDDYRVCTTAGIIKPGDAVVPIDEDGKFTNDVPDYAGVYIKEADNTIMEDLKARGRLLSKGTIKHNYPFCWRSQTPLIYRAFDCWFINVTDIKGKLMEENTKTRWVPTAIQEKRFHNWLHDARDWCFSRNRFWGNPIPIWTSDDGQEVVCIESIAQLEELAGLPKGSIKDIHREHVDKITIPSKQGKGDLKRISEVFDCWFESGSMPFSQSHYPFGISEKDFNEKFPANFIAEGLDQTRGWFYTLMVISTAIKGCAPFQNLIVNGIVLAEDGTKMSKSKKNYPDPTEIANAFGADACRLYLCNSPVVRAEPLKFSKDGVNAVVRDIFLPWFNAYRFMIQNITRWEKRTGKQFIFDPKLKFAVSKSDSANFMDQWIIAANQNLVKLVRKEMEDYKLYNVVRPTLEFLEDLTNWYVRLNRPRMKGDDTTELDQFTALNCLFDVLMNATQLMAPITPFLSEHIYQNMRNGLAPNSELLMDSIHFTQIPNFEAELINEKTEGIVKRMQSAIETGRVVRDQKKVSMKYPLQSVTLIDADSEILAGYKLVERYIKEELNCMDLVLTGNEDEFLTYRAEADNTAMGQAFKKDFNKKCKETISKLTNDELRGYLKNGVVKVGALDVKTGMLKIGKDFNKKTMDNKAFGCKTSEHACVLLNMEQNEDLRRMGLSREVTNRIQRLRKTSGISIEDQIEIYWSSKSDTMKAVLKDQADKMMAQTRMPILSYPAEGVKSQVLVGETEFLNETNADEQVSIWIYLAGPKFDEGKIKAEFGANGDNFLVSMKAFLSQMDRSTLKAMSEKNGGVCKFTLDGKEVSLKRGVHFWFDARDKMGM